MMDRLTDDRMLPAVAFLMPCFAMGVVAAIFVRSLLSEWWLIAFVTGIATLFLVIGLANLWALTKPDLDRPR